MAIVSGKVVWLIDNNYFNVEKIRPITLIHFRSYAEEAQGEDQEVQFNESRGTEYPRTKGREQETPQWPTTSLLDDILC